MCCLRPGIPGVSDTIKVKSIVGRFLEHTRVYYFANSESKVYCASADLMERNLNHRVETCFPLESSKLAQRIVQELLYYVNDGAQGWKLNSDGTYEQLQDVDSIPAQTQLLTTLSS